MPVRLQRGAPAMVDFRRPRPDGISDEEEDVSNGNNDDGSEDDLPVAAMNGGRKKLKKDYPWSHVITVNCPKGKSKCDMCNKYYQSSMNASGWKTHLNKQHGLDRATGLKLKGHVGALGSQSGDSKQTTLNSFGVVVKPIITQKEQERVDHAVVDYFIDDDIAFNRIDQRPFQRLMYAIHPAWVPISARTLCRRILEFFYAMLPVVASFFIKLSGRFSIGVDGWSNCKLKGFYVSTLHWMDEAGLLRDCIFTIFSVAPGRRVSERWSRALFDCALQFGDAFLRKIMFGVTDNGSEALAGMRRFANEINVHLGDDSFLHSNIIRCATHSVQLAAKEALQVLGPIQLKLRTVVKTIRSGKVRRSIDHQEAKHANLGTINPPVLDTRTRWNSTHEMNMASKELRGAGKLPPDDLLEAIEHLSGDNDDEK